MAHVEHPVAPQSSVLRVEQRLQDIDRQLAGYDELARERDRVRRALRELRGDSTAVQPAGGGRAASGRRGSRRRSSGRRAKRGSNVAANPGPA
jgi:hypothetical protein